MRNNSHLWLFFFWKKNKNISCCWPWAGHETNGNGISALELSVGSGFDWEEQLLTGGAKGTGSFFLEVSERACCIKKPLGYVLKLNTVYILLLLLMLI